VIRHEGVSRRAAMARALEMLELVRIPSAKRRLANYPHEMSGGMRQRAMIALALACKPKLLLADEPTTALDATVQIQILLLLRELQREMGMGVIFVTHDIGVAVEVSDKLAVMYAGGFVETGHRGRDHLRRAAPLFAGPSRRQSRRRGAGHSPAGDSRRAPCPSRAARGLRLRAPLRLGARGLRRRSRATLEPPGRPLGPLCGGSGGRCRRSRAGRRRMNRRIVIINPNSTASMTSDMVEIGQSIAPKDVEIVGMTNEAGPPAIQGEADAAACLPGLFALTELPEVEQASGLIIGCFDDTGLEEIRARMFCPVVGLGEAGMLAARLAAPRFAVLTTTDGSVPVIRANIDRMSLASRCDAVAAAHVPVLDLPDRMQDVKSALRDLSEETGTGAIVLGCAGMGRLAGDLAEADLPPLVDPVRAAVALVLSVMASSMRAEAPIRVNT
jgi:Asp/Glu/hydantoin racemase